MSGYLLLLVALAYLGLLFAVAHWGDKLARAPESCPPILRVLRAPKVRAGIYALTLAVYCTAWTYYGSVGLASTTGYNFLPIYIGPILILTFGYPIFRRLLRAAKAQGISSVADFIAARYGKSQALGAVATMVAVIAALPYIALQLKAVANSFAVLLHGADLSSFTAVTETVPLLQDTALPVAVLLGVFAMLFGTRHIDSSEHHQGLMLAIAFESIVKLVAFVAVGAFVTFTLFGDPLSLVSTALADPAIEAVFRRPLDLPTLMTSTVLAALAFICLPRQFHVAIVENEDESHLRSAMWLFPLYLVGINLFVIPLAMAGLLTVGGGAGRGDIFVLAVPLTQNEAGLALLAFLGGLSAATAMVIVSCVALSTMICNNLVVPFLLRERAGEAMVLGGAESLKRIRRLAIVLVLTLGFLYYRLATGDQALADIGLLSFALISQLAPAVVGGVFWRRGSARGVFVGLIAGLAIWAYMLLVPTMMKAGTIPSDWASGDLFGLFPVDPQSFLGGGSLGFLTHGVLWSLGANLAFFIAISLLSRPSATDTAQAEAFVRAVPEAEPIIEPELTKVTRAELFRLVERFLGTDMAKRAMRAWGLHPNIEFFSSDRASPELLRRAERLLAGSIGPASARAVIALSFGGRRLGPRRARQLLVKASEAIRYSQDLLHATIEHIQEGVAVFDDELRLAVANHKFRTMLDLPEHLTEVGVRLSEIVSYLAMRGMLGEGEVEDLIRIRMAELEGRLPTTLDRRQPSGAIYDVRTNPMPEGGIIITYTDVTERVRFAEALKASNEGLEARVAERTGELMLANKALRDAKQAAEGANETKTRFLAAASHDLMQPLNAARLFSGALSDRPVDPETADLVSKIESSLVSLDDLLGSLVEISRLDSQTIKPDIRPFALGDLMEQLRVEFDAIAAKKGIELVVVSTKLAVVSDRRLLRRILQNLLSNAVRYTRTGRVLMGCRRSRGELRIEVHDTGPGIAAEDQKLIFREFFRLRHASQASGERSLGLGLAIVERSAGLLSHSVGLKSTPGRGSVFSVSVPLYSGTLSRRAAATAAFGRPSPMAGLKVLCLDDDGLILDGLSAIMRGWGCRVETASRFEEAVRKVGAGFQPDLLILDFHLAEDLNGLEALESLRTVLDVATPAIFITAERSPQIIELVMQSGCPLLSKPVKPAALRSLLNRLGPAAAADSQEVVAADGI